MLKQKDIAENLLSRYVYCFLNRRKEDDRPWGYWETLYLGDSFKVKHIFAAPGELLSLQRHKHRTEMWSVVEGSGVVTVGQQNIPVRVGDVVTINKGEIHRAEGGKEGLHIIEVQLGDYLGEDDIERLEDKYGRS